MTIRTTRKSIYFLYLIKKYNNKMPKFYNMSICIQDISNFLDKWGISVYETKDFYSIEATFILKHVLPRQQYICTSYCESNFESHQSSVSEDDFDKLLNIICNNEIIDDDTSCISDTHDTHDTLDTHDTHTKSNDLEVLNLDQLKKFLIKMTFEQYKVKC